MLAPALRRGLASVLIAIGFATAGVPIVIPGVVAHAATAASPPPSPAARPGLPGLQPATAESVLARVRASRGHAVLVNVWATWCAPCREEFPDLVRLHRRYRERGFDLVLVSADAPDQTTPARRFLAKQGVDFPSFIKRGGDMAFIDGLHPKWSGALPASLLYDGRGTLRYFHEGRLDPAVIEREILALLEPRSSTTTGEDP